MKDAAPAAKRASGAEPQHHTPYRDPLLARHPGFGAAHAPSYWAATAGCPPDDDGAVPEGLETEVAIVGGGYTGLSCAYFLAKQGIPAVVLEANRPGWGCSGRNGGFARPAIGRLPYATWVRRWGREGARAVFHEALNALETVRGLIREGNIACDAQPEGWLKIAHRTNRMKALEAERELLARVFGFEVELLDRAALAERHFRGGEAFGALRWPVSFAMHPLKLVHGLQHMARAAGARIHSASPVLGWGKHDGFHQLETPGGRVRARNVVLASNGYTIELLFPALQGRLLPVLSNIVVTQPLSEEEVRAGNFVTTDAMSDTRKLLYYFRRLPDNRVMLGGKGPLRDEAPATAAHKEHLLAVVRAKFPFIRQPRADYFWGGWVALTPDFVPHVATFRDDPSVTYALGYMGSGVSFSMQAGKRMAELIATGRTTLPQPVAEALPRFAAPGWRRFGQRLMMRWYALRDAR